MANIKEYTIKINGLTESIDAVKSLEKQLAELDTRIKALESRKVSISANASTGGSSSRSGGGSRTSAVSEEEKLERQIEQIDAKRVAYSKEIYQNYLAAKDVLNETVKDQKQLAAQERVAANAYSNTMEGIKQKLADLKSVHFTTDISTDEFKQQEAEINSLTNKLKELEEAYGVFSRNVGNYQSAFDGFEKVTVNINGVTKEFNNLMQAQKAVRNEMGILIDKGKENTDQYKKLEQELERLAKSQKKLNSAMNDANASSRAMDDILDTFESFGALGQISQGFSTLFGFDDSEIERQIAKLVALQNALQGIEKIRKQMETGEGIGGWLAKGSRAIDTYTAKLFGAQKRMGLFIAETRKASVAANMFAKSMKVIGGIALTGGVMLLTTVIGNLIEKFMQWADAGIEAGDATKILNSYVNTLSNTSERLISEKVDAYFSGIASEAETARGILYEMTTNVLRLYNALNLINGIEFKKLNENFESLSLLSTGGDIDEARSKFISLAKDIEQLDKKAKDSILGETIAGWWNGLRDAKKNYKELGKAIADDFMARAEEATKKAQTEVIRFGYVQKETARQIKDLKNEMEENYATNSILKNIEQFCDNSDVYVQAIESIKKSFNDLSNSITVTDVDKLAQLYIDGLAESEEKIRKQNELNRKREIKENGFNPDYVQAINAKYDRELEENLKAYRKTKKQELDQKKKEERDVQNEIDDYKLQLMKEGLEKETKALENERDQKLQEIADSGIRVQERQSLVWAVYDKKITELQKDWANEMREIYGDLYRDIEKMNNEMIDASLDLQESILKADTSKSKDFAGDRGITPQSYNDSKSLEQYYKEILKVEQEAADEENRINQERIALQKKTDEEEEKLRHDKLVREGSGEYAKQLEAGKITLEQYNKLIEEENKAHAEKMQQIEDESYVNSEKSLQASLDKKKKAYSDYYTSTIAVIRKEQDKISKGMSKAEVTNSWGFINIGATNTNYDALIKKEKEAIEKIKAERDKLKQDKDSGKIKGEDFLVRMEELDAAEDAAMSTLKDLETKSQESVGKFMQTLSQYVQVAMQSIQQIMQAVWDAQDYQMEKEFNELDKLNEELDKKLQEQQDIVEKHKDNVESIEDELATARGDRRQHLIDQINAEVDAQRAAQREEQRIQKEQEKAKKREEALEKKRREQEYKRNVMQAFVSWHLAIANGLATQPFLPVGIAMGALATTLGAIQYALVKSQKPYAKGGLLEGPSHKQGGIPVGNTGIEVEGKEYVIRKKSTAPNIDILDYINRSERKLSLDDFIDFYGGKVKKSVASMSPGRKFADGGSLPTLSNNYEFDDRLLTAFEDYANKPTVVSVVEITDKMSNVRNTQVLAGLEPTF